MSLILDALNRAEHERKNKNAVPDINTIHMATPVRNGQPWAAKPIAALMAVSLVAIAVILGIWLLRSPGEVSQSTSTIPAPEAVSTSTPSAPVPAAHVTALPAVAPSTVAPVAPSSAPSASDVAPSNVAPSNSPSAAPAPAVEDLYAANADTAKAPDASVEKLYEPDEEPVSESIVSPFATSPDPVAADPNAQANQQPDQLVTVAPAKPQRHYQEVEAPEFNGLAWNQKQQIPTISYSRHNYLPQNVSTVVINGETLGEGNSFSGGNFVVDEIFVDGVVLSYRGNKFKLRALSGWVNM